MHLPEQFDNLVRQWNVVSFPHFRLARRDRPETLIKIELRPFRMAQFTGAHEHMRGELQGEFSDALAL